jgi:hypothetical protein
LMSRFKSSMIVAPCILFASYLMLTRIEGIGKAVPGRLRG